MYTVHVRCCGERQVNRHDRTGHDGRVPLIRRRPELLPLQVPHPDGSTWPTRREVGRQSFAASALYRMGHGEAFTPEAHDIADPLIAQVLPRLRTDAASEDRPYLHRLFSSAAQLGAGIGLVERRVVRHDAAGMDRQVAGALLEAADELPVMPDRHQDVAVYLMQCGYYLARTDVARLPLLLTRLGGEG